MGTDKRERQKANRQLKYQQQAKEHQRRKLTKRVILGGVAVVGLLGVVLLLAWLANRGDGDDAAPPATSVATTQAEAPGTVPVPELAGPTTPAEFTYGAGECPPEEVGEAVKTFAEAPQQCIDPAATYTATFATDRGDIVVELDTANSPGTVNNFVTLARYGYYDDTAIFRTNTSIDIIQGGGLTNTDSPGYEIPDEGTGYQYPPGVLAMARTQAPNSAGGQWFFTTGPNSAGLADAGTYVVFGRVTEGSDIAAEINALAGADGDTPTSPVAVESVTITES